MALAAEAREAVLDVGGIARLAHLAVAHHVDARRPLPFHDLPHGTVSARLQACLVYRLAFRLAEHHLDEVVRPRQAPGVRGQNAIGAALHAQSPIPR